MIYRDESRHMYKRWYKDHYSPKVVYFSKEGGGNSGRCVFVDEEGKGGLQRW